MLYISNDIHFLSRKEGSIDLVKINVKRVSVITKYLEEKQQVSSLISREVTIIMRIHTKQTRKYFQIYYYAKTKIFL